MGLKYTHKFFIYGTRTELMEPNISIQAMFYQYKEVGRYFLCID